MKTLIAALFLLVTPFASAKTPTYHQLALKDLDQMAALVKNKIKDAHQSPDSTDMAPLKEAVRDVYSRPDDDAMIEKVIGPLRSEIDDLDGWDTVMTELVDESLATLKNPKGVKADEQVTHIIFLQNVIATLKPKKEGGVAKKLLEQIRDAKIENSKEIRDERKLRMMKDAASPSDVAAQVLKGSDNKK